MLEHVRYDRELEFILRESGRDQRTFGVWLKVERT